MASELRFIKDFDSFNVEAGFFEIVYGAKIFRFGYASTNEHRKFSFTSFGKTKVTLPEVLLQYQNGGVWEAIIVNFSMEFEDVLKLAEFVQKLAQVVGYQQMPVDKTDLSTNMQTDSENDDDDDDDGDSYGTKMHPKKSNQSDIEDLKQIEMAATRPRFVFIEDRAQPPLIIMAAAGAFDIGNQQTGRCYRFVHNPVIANRTYEVNPSGFGRNSIGRSRYFVKNVILQGPTDQNGHLEVFPPRAGPGVGVGGYVDLAEVDLFFDLCSSPGLGLGNLHLMLAQNHYRKTN